MGYKGIRGVEVFGELTPEYEEILDEGAVSFVATLVRMYAPRRGELLLARRNRQKIILIHPPDFPHETEEVRKSSWVVAPIPHDLCDRRVEITGPASSRKMVINALNSGAKVYMADAEDSESPTWENIIQGQINLRDAVRGTVSYESDEGKKYTLKNKTATLMFRPRGLHLLEKHFHVDGEPVPASLFDFGLYFYHNARTLVSRISGPYFYLPKLENYREARWWSEVFAKAEELSGIPHRSIRATVLIETILAAFQMDEILYELRDYSAGLNCGRWDYIFSFIKKFAESPNCILPDRAEVTMDKAFLAAYVELLVQTCHRRGAHAMGGMSAQVPIKNNPELNEAALGKVRADKLREVRAGHDGTWVAHPGLVPVAMEIFDAHIPAPNQIHAEREHRRIRATDLLEVPRGVVTEQGLRVNINVGLRYLEAWLRGVGCAQINNLMEDAATAEISRAQVWQWIRHGAELADGRKVTHALYEELLTDEFRNIRESVSEEEYRNGKYQLAAAIFDKLVRSKEFEEFLTLPAYEELCKVESSF